jgi:hypothetical protein
MENHLRNIAMPMQNFWSVIGRTPGFMAENGTLKFRRTASYNVLFYCEVFAAAVSKCFSAFDVTQPLACTI